MKLKPRAMARIQARNIGHIHASLRHSRSAPDRKDRRRFELGVEVGIGSDVPKGNEVGWLKPGEGAEGADVAALGVKVAD
jgi:hypothetical protein